MMKNKYLYKILWGIAITAIFLFFLYKIQKFSLKDLISIIQKASLASIIISFFLILFANIFRSLRFYTLLMNNHVLFRNIFGSNNIYNLTTATLPGGVGEIISMFIFKKYNNINTGSAFSVLVLSRLLDLMSLSTLLFFSSLFYKFKLQSVLLAISAFCIVFSVFLLIPSVNRTFIKIVNLLLPPIKITQKIKHFLGQVEEGLSCINSFHKWIIVSSLSFLMIFLSIISVKLVLSGINIHLSFIKTVICFGIYAVLQMVPVHGIGGIGTQEAWWTLGLTSVGVPKAKAVPASFLLHGIFYVFILIIAILFGFPMIRNRPKERSIINGNFLSK